VPPAGDYNRDGKLDTNDFSEWRKAFGESQPQFMYADGNNDAMVDAADFVIWRKALTAGSGAAIVPEPASLTIIIGGFVALIWSRKSWRRDGRQQ
jgi:hypothetical protein